MSLTQIWFFVTLITSTFVIIRDLLLTWFLLWNHYVAEIPLIELLKSKTRCLGLVDMGQLCRNVIDTVLTGGHDELVVCSVACVNLSCKMFCTYDITAINYSNSHETGHIRLVRERCRRWITSTHVLVVLCEVSWGFGMFTASAYGSVRASVTVSVRIARRIHSVWKSALYPVVRVSQGWRAGV